jgi:PAS domain S-box-containing protein
VESANSAIVTSDQEGGIISWNRAALDIFGYTQEEVLGHPVTMLIPERYHAACQRSLERAAETEGSMVGITQEFRALKKDGPEFPVELSLFSWQAGSRRFYGAIIQDITGRK